MSDDDLTMRAAMQHSKQAKLDTNEWEEKKGNWPRKPDTKGYVNDHGILDRKIPVPHKFLADKAHRKKRADKEEKEEYKALFTAGYIHQDFRDNSRMYLIGRLNNRATIIKFGKRKMNIDWKL